MEIILRRMQRTNKIEYSNFEYIKSLIKELDWPFYQFDLQPTPLHFKEVEFEGDELDISEDDEERSFEESELENANDESSEIQENEGSDEQSPTSDQIERPEIEETSEEPDSNLDTEIKSETKEIESQETPFDYPEK